MIYIVEDDQSILELEIYALRRAGYEAEGFQTAAEFRQAMERQLPQLALVDVMLPGEDGLSLLRAIREKPATRRMPVIMVTALGTERDKVDALDVGADDYIVKPFGVMELIARVRALLRRAGQEEEQQEVLTVGSITLDRLRRRVKVDGGQVTLTHLEFELLGYLMSRPGIAVTREKLLEEVWGMSNPLDTRTVDVHIRTLRQKLGSAGAMIGTVRGTGYRLEEDHA